LTQSVYICGDSFTVDDKEYDQQPWSKQIDAVSLGSVCATNQLIALQVEHAIREQASFIIVEFTSVTRDIVQFADKKQDSLFDRFYSLTAEDNQNKDLTSYTIWATNNASALTQEQRDQLDSYNKNFFDIDVAIHRDRLIIEATLQQLVDSGIPFLFDQGGFEHSSYGGVGTYFKKFEQYRSKYCLWDYADTRTFRPYYHITDQSVHDTIAEYYNNFIQG
jgi:hypothetical protein